MYSKAQRQTNNKTVPNKNSSNSNSDKLIRQSPLYSIIQRSKFIPGSTTSGNILQSQNIVGKSAAEGPLARAVNTPAFQKQSVRHKEVSSKENQTGLPNNLKAGMENLSGISMNDVTVHLNSSKPAELQALAYTQGTNIYVGPGQEKHIPHEAWHVIQQKQGRVKPTNIQIKGASINDDLGLETEADRVAGKIMRMSDNDSPNTDSGKRLLEHVQQIGGLTGNPSISTLLPSIIQRRAEVHVNLQGEDRVKVYRDSDSDLDYLASSGKPTSPTALGNFSITSKRNDRNEGRWGLQYFATFNGGQGFHSNIAYPLRQTLCDENIGNYCQPRSDLNKRVEYRLTVDGTERSHGCVRLGHNDASELYGNVIVGTPVKIYREGNFRPSPFVSSNSNNRSSRNGQTRREHIIQRGETLGGIARHYGVREDAIRDSHGNRISNPHQIRAGDTLIIPNE